MRINTKSALAIFALCIIGFSTYALAAQFGLPFVIPHGYDGIASEITSIDHDLYEETEVTMLGEFYYKGINVDAGFDVAPLYPWGTDPTGIKMTVTAPSHESTLDLDPLLSNETYFEDGVKMIRTTTLRRSIVTFEMHSTVKTYDPGGAPIENIIFWIELKNNDDSVFTDPESIGIAILSVRTDEAPDIEQKGIDIDFFPDAGGQDLPLYAVNGTEVSRLDIPTQAGINVDNFNQLQVVRFPVEIINAQPILAFLNQPRVDCQVTFDFKIEVLLLGQWTVYRPYAEYIPPIPELTWWEQFTGWISDVWTGFTEFLGSPIGMAYTILVFVIIAVVIIVIIRMFVRRGS